jgi:putative membrane protein
MRNLMRVCVAACAFGFAVAALPAGDQKIDDKSPLTEAQFVMKASSSAMHEVELGKLGVTNAANPDVKKFADRMVTDHSKAIDGLKAAAKAANIPVPDKMTPEHQKELDRFRTLKGADFDKAYMAHMVKDHEAGEALYSKAAKDLKDPGLKGFAEKTLPTVQEHLKLAKQVNEKIGKQ